MTGAPWDKRFFASTRGRIVALLRRATRTVDELAQLLDLTDNAVRAHLATLERDGLVHQQGVRRGSGKPAYAYELTPEAERLFPKPYAPVLRQLLDVIDQRMVPEEVEALLRRVGSELASGLRLAEGDVRARLEAAVAVLNELGGLAELEERDGAFVIRGYSCPLAAVVPGHPEVCRLAETLVSEVAGVPVTEHCDRSEPLRCAFAATGT
ncbi:MAG: helix-turn-helix domain-containing protein [Chloroflexota bacterium]|nr:helix-turn-helix domain-containing protein [Chloroflexota bacterium]